MRTLLSTVVATTVSALCLAAPAVAAPSVGISTASAPPTGSVTLLAGGFDPGALVDVFFDTTEVGLATTNSSGALGSTFTIPADAQPGTHWVTVDEMRTHAAAQASLSVATNWPQDGYGPSGRGFNPLENTIGTGNVGQLTQAWSTPVSSYSNPKPFVFYQGLYLVDESGVVHAYTPGGALRWTATPPPPDSVVQPSPAAGNGLVVFADGAGDVRAYNYLCRTDGGACTSSWSRNIGTRITGGLTIRNGLVYVPGNDGHIHVLTLATGAPGTDLVPLGSGALTSPAVFSPDGAAYVAQGTALETINRAGKSNITYGGTVSPPALGNDAAYVTTSDGHLHMSFGWDDAIGAADCATAPAYADNVVYAASCNTLGAYDAGTGAVLWSVATAYETYALSVANGVLYACVGGRLVGYAASYGERLWTGGYCAGRPIVVNGTVYGTSDSLSAYTLTGANATSLRSARRRRPNPRRLHRSAHFRRKLAAEHARARGHGRPRHAARR